jgi:hypothetical protein
MREASNLAHPTFQRPARSVEQLEKQVKRSA